MKPNRHFLARTLPLAALALSVSLAQPARAVGWVTNSPMNFARQNHTATLLPNGKVLVAGGENNNTGVYVCPTNTEVFDPAGGTWTTNGIGSLSTGRVLHTATMLPNGKVLVAGGDNFTYGSGWRVLSSAELFDPASGIWTAAATMAAARYSHTATLLPNGKVLVAAGWNGANNNPTNSAELYDPATGTWTTTGPLNTARYGQTATLLANGKVLVVAGQGDLNTGYGPLNSAEIYDPATGTWSTTGSLNIERQWHTATLLPNGKVLVAGGMDSNGDTLDSAELYDPGSGTWTTNGIGSLATPRLLHTATVLPNGHLMVVGGLADNGYPSGNDETFDPSSGAWNWTYSLPSIGLVSHTTTLLPGGKLLVTGGNSGRMAAITLLYDWPDGTWEGTWSTTGALTAARDEHTATLLPNGKVLAVGGAGTSSPLSNSDLYDPTSGIWTATGSLHDARQWHTATLLTNGQVLVAAGSGGSGFLASAELYNPTGATWTVTGSLTTAREYHTATLLASGKVLVAGGYGSGAGYLASAELYDPASGTWTPTGSLTNARGYHTATLLPNGKVLIAGGRGNGDSFLGSAELYDPASGSWTATGPLTTARANHTANLLVNGRVLATGGCGIGYSHLASAELYNPASGTWTSTGSLNTTRQWHTATLLSNGKVLAAGGYNGSYLASAELYDPGSGTWTATGSLTARQWHTATLLASGKVLAAGGYNGGAMSSAELYDIGWGFSSSWQPQIATFTSPLAVNGSLALTGSNFRGISEGSGGNGNQDSPADYPVVQLRRLDNEQTVFLLATSWQTNSYTSAPVSGIPAGWAMLTVFVNGIPSQSSVLLVQPAITVTIPPFRITNPTKVAGGAYQFTFTNTPGGSFTVLAATNAALSLSGWLTAGAATEVSSGRYQFSDPQAGNTPRRFYRVRSP